MLYVEQKKKKPQVEILSPAGSYESFLAAIHAGADAVYAGGSRFGARAFADNFTEETLKQAIDYAHFHGRKVYLTVNTLLKDREIETLHDYLEPLYLHGLDAVIVQDVGVLELIRGTAGSLTVESQFFRRRRIKSGAALRTGQFLSGGHGKRRFQIVSVRTAVAGQPGIHQTETVKQFGSGTESAANAGDAGALAQGESTVPLPEGERSPRRKASLKKKAKKSKRPRLQ